MAQAIVGNFADLKSAAQDPSIDYIYVTSDIMLETGGILIPKNKPSLIIDCRYPDNETGTISTITDMNDLLQTNSIRVAGVAGSFALTLKNCKFIGRNYYGAISCVNSVLQNSTTLTLENVEYSGPQSSYNRYGTVEIIGGKYTIDRLNGTTASTNEFTEANRLIMSGNIDIYHNGTSNSCLYLSEANPQFILRENAKLNVESVSRELFYLDVASLDFAMEANSKLHSKTQWSMFYSAGMSANSFVMAEGAEFVFDQQAVRAGVATIQCSGNMSVGAGARMIVVKKNFSSTDPLIRFSTTATASFSDPLAVVLYNPGGRTITWAAGTGTLDINAEIINYWLSATPFPSAGTFEDIPLYNWTKADKTNATINASLSSSSTTGVTTNLVVDTDAPVIPTTSSFNVQSSRVLAFGRLPLDVLPLPKQSDTTIEGETLGNANVRAIIDAAASVSVSDADGGFSIALGSPIQKNDKVEVGANIDFKIKTVSYIADGIIELIVPERLKFVRFTSPTKKLFYNRVETGWSIIIRDSRNNGSDWSLYAQAVSPLTYQSFQLPDALVYKEGNVINHLETPAGVKIFEGIGNTDPDFTETTIQWPADQGILIHEQLETVCNRGHYEAPINFTLVEKT